MSSSESDSKSLKPISGPAGWPFIGNLLDLRDADYPLMALERLAARYGPMYQINNQGVTRAFACSVDTCDAMCDESRFCKLENPNLRNMNSQDTRPPGLFTAPSDSDAWALAHKILMPAFGPLSIESLFDGMHDIAKQLALNWARQGPDQPLCATDDFTRVTLDTIALCGMGFRFNSFYSKEQHPFVRAMTETLAEASRRGTRPAFVTKMMTGTRAKLQENIELQNEIGQEIVSKRRREGSGKQTDLLDKMVNGRDPATGRSMDDALISANMQTFLIAGHETTSSLLSFVMYNLLKHPAAYNAAQKEVDTVIGDSAIKSKHLKQLKYINAVLRETLRLHPTAPAFSRHVKPGVDDEVFDVDGFALPRDVPVTVLLSRVHQDPKVYGPDPEAFRPERMLDEHFEKLPQNSWKPFGSGVRACIGRAFAWQEALLVTALLLQRFDFKLDNPAYDLNIQFNLTIKPKDLMIRAKLRNGVDATSLDMLMSSGEGPKPAHENGKRLVGGVSGENPMTILYGSNTGTCEALAQRLAVDATAHGYKASVESLDSAARSVPKSQPVIVITASYEGQPPDNARRFIESISELNDDDLEGVNYAVFGCGHRDWVPTFHRIPKLVDRLFHEAGAYQVSKPGFSDVANGEVYDDFDTWKEENLWPSLSECVPAGKSVQNTKPASTGLQMEVSSAQHASGTKRQDVIEAEVVDSRYLTAPDQPQKRHCEFRLPERLSYQNGDYLAVLPYNPAELVEQVLKRFGLDENSSIRIKHGSPTTLPTEQWIKAQDLVAGYVELSQAVTLKDLKRFSDLTMDLRERTRVEDLIETRADPRRKKYLTSFDVLSSFPSINMSFAEFLALLPPLRVRLYSISSSPLKDPSLCTVTYSVYTDGPTRDSPSHPGVASTYLASLKPGSTASVSIKPGKPTFQLPSMIDQGQVPLIMICAGTGLAPFRGFIQDRFEQLHQYYNDNNEITLAPAILFAGCRSSTGDRLYADEIDHWATGGAVKVRYAFSKEPEKSEGCKYVQERLLKEKELLRELWKAGGKIYVCGSNAMVAEVRKTLRGLVREALEEQGKDLSDEEMTKRLEKTTSDRFVADVFG